MGGAIIQLAAYGSQDIYLTGKPEITFFKFVYKQYTHFAMESISLPVESTAGFGRTVSCNVARNGDLLGRITLEVELPPAEKFIDNTDFEGYSGYIQGIGNYLVDFVSIQIGGNTIDEQYGKWMDVWSQITIPNSLQTGYGNMVGKNTGLPYETYDVQYEPGNRLFIPLQFWFCSNPGLAIPLIALQYDEVRLKITFQTLKNLTVAVLGDQYQPVFFKENLNLNFNNFKIYGNYYYLDTKEKIKFAQNPHEYLIEQIQYQKEDTNSLVEPNAELLNLNHPVKELIWTFNRNPVSSFAPQNDFSIGKNRIPNGTPKQFAPLYVFRLQINGNNRFSARSGEYFRLQQNFEYHTRIPSNYIYVYSFAIKPEDDQPSGTCNFSRIDNSYFNFIFRTNVPCTEGNKDGEVAEDYAAPPKLNIWARSYNILRIMSGKAGLAYSN